jgi:ferric-dicitrate binding protein FerR (iron transport regulator)
MNAADWDKIDEWSRGPDFRDWLAGKDSPGAQGWAERFRASPEEAELAEFTRITSSLRVQPPTWEPDREAAALAEFQRRMAASQARKPAVTRRMIPRRAWFTAAAVLLLLLGFYGYDRFTAPADIVVTNNTPGRETITLPDGSTVVLNEAATLRYAPGEVRRVRLTGEAYFRVTKQPTTSARFEVTTADLTVTVLGTEFNVKAFGDQTTVYLDEGKVQLELGPGSGKQLSMVPGELVAYSKQRGRILDNRTAHPLESTSWLESVARFEDAPLSEVLDAITAIYGIQLNLAPALRAQQETLNNKTNFNGGIPTNNLDLSLQTLRDVYDLETEQRGSTYTLRRRQ